MKMGHMDDRQAEMMLREKQKMDQIEQDEKINLHNQLIKKIRSKLNKYVEENDIEYGYGYEDEEVIELISLLIQNKVKGIGLINKEFIESEKKIREEEIVGFGKFETFESKISDTICPDFFYSLKADIDVEKQLKEYSKNVKLRAKPSQIKEILELGNEKVSMKILVKDEIISITNSSLLHIGELKQKQLDLYNEYEEQLANFPSFVNFIQLCLNDYYYDLKD